MTGSVNWRFSLVRRESVLSAKCGRATWRRSVLPLERAVRTAAPAEPCGSPVPAVRSRYRRLLGAGGWKAAEGGLAASSSPESRGACPGKGVILTLVKGPLSSYSCNEDQSPRRPGLMGLGAIKVGLLAPDKQAVVLLTSC